MHTILTAVDLTAATDAVIDQTRQFAKAFGSRVYLLHVEAPDADFVGYDVGPQAVRDDIAHTIAADHHTLQDLADSLRPDAPHVEPLIIQGPTVQKIHDEARRLEADLLIVGAHTHGPLYTLVHGQTTEAILKHAPCPVLVVPTT